MEAVENTMQYFMRSIMVIVPLICGCGTFASHDHGSPASHHAARKYNEAVQKGLVVPQDKAGEGRS